MDDMRTAARRLDAISPSPAHTSPHSRSRRVVPTRRATMAASDAEDADDNAVVLLDDSSDGGADAAGGTDDEAPGPAATDDDPAGSGENYFGRAAKEGAAPEGANPFAAAAAPADDWMAEIEAAKKQVEAQRVAREREQAIELEKEREAAELAGKKFEGRRRAGEEPDPAADPSANASAAAPAARAPRRTLKAKRPGAAAGGGASGTAPGPNAAANPSASPFAGFSLLEPPAAEKRPPAEPPKPTPGLFAFPPQNAPSGEDAPFARSNAPAAKPSVLSRLSGAPAPFVAPTEDDDGAGDDAAEDEEEEEEEEEGGADAPSTAAFSFAAGAPSGGFGFAPGGGSGPSETGLPAEKTGLFAPAIGETNGNGAPATAAGARTALAIELDL